jgi:hypothetical protein
LQLDSLIGQQNRSLVNDWIQNSPVFPRQPSIEPPCDRLLRAIPKATPADLFIKPRYHISLRKSQRLEGFWTAQDAYEFR